MARLSDGTVTVDAPGSRRRTGRGAYVCPEEACVSRALRSGLKRTLRIEGALPEGLPQALLGRVMRGQDAEPKGP